MPDLGLASGLKTNNLDKEIAILKSKRLMRSVVKSLDLYISFIVKGNVRDVELYKNDVPFDLKILKINQKEGEEFNGGSYNVDLSDNGELYITNLGNLSTLKGHTGSPIDLGFATVVIIPKDGVDDFHNITMNFSSLDEVASGYRGGLQIIQEKENSNVIKLVLEDPVIEKAKDIIDQVIFEFNKDAIDDKNLIASNTANFINERLDIINGELENVETGKEEFKENNRLTDIKTESQLFVQTASEYNEKRQEIGTQMELVNAMLDYLSSSSNSELLPANLGIQESAVNHLIGEYNDLVLQRNRIMRSSTELNPAVIRINNNIEQIKANILQSLQRLRNNLQISQNEVNRQVQSVGSKILAVPSQEREYRGIERQQSIKEALYLYLLQKREENSLALAVTAPKAKIVDSAHSNGLIVSPKKKSILLGSLVLGLFIPFSIIYLRDVMDNKVRKRSDIEDYTREIAVVGEIPKVKEKKELIIDKHDRSMLAESYRFLITNLQFLLLKSENNGKARKILITSTIKGEGKTFTAINLAVTLAFNQKNVLLVGADLRNPKLDKYQEESECRLGISDYLVSENSCIKNFIKNSRLHPGLKILGSGSIPPNPSELLRSEKVDEMFKEIENLYDYIIIDSAPTMLVTDTLIINKYADLTLYLIRAGVSDKDLLDFVLANSRSGNMSQVNFILNGVSTNELGYGNKYGYGYGTNKKPNFDWRSYLNYRNFKNLIHRES